MMMGKIQLVLILVTIVNVLYGLPTDSRRRLEENAGAVEGDMFFAATSGRGLGVRRSGARWTNGTVPYEILAGFRAGSETVIVNAMRRLERAVAVNYFNCIRFRPKVASDLYFIRIQNGSGCSSYVGQPSTPSFNHLVTLQDPGCIDEGTIMHELLHTLGFLHEQSRPDRDSYIRINTQNIIPGTENNFFKYDNNMVDTQNTSYDYGSLMHYDRYAFTRNGQPTIEPLQANATIGQRSTMSSTDILEVQLYYGCPTTVTSTTTMTTIISTYDSALTNRSAVFSRLSGYSSNFYFQAFRVYVFTPGNYSFISNSTVDMYGYIYNSNFDPSNLSLNLLTADDDSAGSLQFRLNTYLYPGSTYILVATTYSPAVTTSFSIIGSGPYRLYFVPIAPVIPTTSTTTTSTTTVPCNARINRPICPERVWTFGRRIIIEPAGRTLTSLSLASDGIFFNLEDPVSINGYLKTVTVQYNPRRLPTAAAGIRIYGVVPVSGGYTLCSQYLVPTSQITTQFIQTYTIPDNLINLFNTTYIGVGIQDTSASIATTYGGMAFWASNADQVNGAGQLSTVYFRPHVWRFGAKITYTIIA